MLGCTEGHLTFWHLGVVFADSDGAASAVHVVGDITTDEMLKVLHWVDACVALLSFHKSAEGLHWFWLRSVSYCVAHGY